MILHASGHVVLVGLIVGYASMGMASILTRRMYRATNAVWIGLLVIGVVQLLTGVVLAIRGPGPADFTHWVYGVVLMTGLLVSHGLAMSASPRGRGLVMLTSSTLLLLVAWRLSETA